MLCLCKHYFIFNIQQKNIEKGDGGEHCLTHYFAFPLSSNDYKHKCNCQAINSKNMFRTTIQKRGLRVHTTTKKKRYPTERKKTSIKRNAENELAEPSRKSVVCVFYILHAVYEKQTKSVYMIKGGVNHHLLPDRT